MARPRPKRGEGHEKPLTRIRIDQDTVTMLERQRMTPDSVPGAGQRVRVRQDLQSGVVPGATFYAGGHQVRVNAIGPGLIATPLNAKARENPGSWWPYWFSWIERQAPERVERLALLSTNARADNEEQVRNRSALIKLAEPTGNAKYVHFITLQDPKRMPGQKQAVLEYLKTL